MRGYSYFAQPVFAVQRRKVSGLMYRDDCKHAFINLNIMTVYIFQRLLFFKQHECEHIKHSGIHKYHTREKN